jgi:hypothetical protein
VTGRRAGYLRGMPAAEGAPRRTDHDDPEMYRHSDDPEPDAGEGATDGGAAAAGEDAQEESSPATGRP